ncbi:MAG: hypothetical protein SGARI_004638, partial [Bacillariaceae sp.]
MSTRSSKKRTDTAAAAAGSKRKQGAISPTSSELPSESLSPVPFDNTTDLTEESVAEGGAEEVEQEEQGPTEEELKAMDPIEWLQKYAPMAAFNHEKREWTAPNGAKIRFNSKGVTVPVLRGYCNNKMNRVCKEDGKSFRGAKKNEITDAIVLMATRIKNKQEPRPWLTKKKSATETVVPVNKFRLGNVLFSSKMDGPCKKRGDALKKDDLITGVAASKSGDQPFFEAARMLYNSNDKEFDKLQFGFNVPEENHPSQFIPIDDHTRMKRVYKDVMLQVDKKRREQNRSGTNDSDDEVEIDGEVRLPEATIQYVLYWNEYANHDKDRFDNFNAELADEIKLVLGGSNKAASKSAAKKQNKPDSAELLAQEFKRGNDFEERVFKKTYKQGKKRDKVMSKTAHIASVAKLREQRAMVDDKRSQKWKDAMSLIDGTEREQKKEVRSRLKAFQKGEYTAAQLSEDTI